MKHLMMLPLIAGALVACTSPIAVTQADGVAASAVAAAAASISPTIASDVETAVTTADKYCTIATIAGPVAVALAPTAATAVTDIETACQLVGGITVPATSAAAP